MKKLFCQTTRIHGGLGLGLAVSRTIIKNLKGKLHIAPAEPVGLSVTVELPLEISNKDSLENNATENMATTTTEIKDKTILVAEDNLVNQKLMRTFLQELKLNVDICNNGKEAVDAFIRKKYDLVLMDIQMPIMDGIEATKRIRSLDNGQVPIIAVTATSEYTSLEKCQSVGINDCLPKPVRLNDIRTRLTTWLSQEPKQL